MALYAFEGGFTIFGVTPGGGTPAGMVNESFIAEQIVSTSGYKRDGMNTGVRVLLELRLCDDLPGSMGTMCVF